MPGNNRPHGHLVDRILHYVTLSLEHVSPGGQILRCELGRLPAHLINFYFLLLCFFFSLMNTSLYFIPALEEKKNRPLYQVQFVFEFSDAERLISHKTNIRHKKISRVVCSSRAITRNVFLRCPDCLGMVINIFC